MEQANHFSLRPFLDAVVCWFPRMSCAYVCACNYAVGKRFRGVFVAIKQHLATLIFVILTKKVMEGEEKFTSYFSHGRNACTQVTCK